jgi:hypothetical protein
MSSALRSAASLRTVALALCLLPLAASAQVVATAAPFQPVPWGSSVDSLKTRAAHLGWDFVEVDADGDYTFRAVIDGEPALVFATFGKKGLTRLLVSVDPHPGATVTFKHIRDSVSTRLGPALMTTEGESAELPARSMLAATAWQGVMMGLRRDGRILVVLTCPESSPTLPNRRGGPPIA